MIFFSTISTGLSIFTELGKTADPKRPGNKNCQLYSTRV